MASNSAPVVWNSAPVVCNPAPVASNPAPVASNPVDSTASPVVIGPISNPALSVVVVAPNSIPVVVPSKLIVFPTVAPKSRPYP